jgi:hypothetical protein
MIAYVQQETTKHWDKLVTGWINGLISSAQPGWTAKDMLVFDRTDASLRLSIFRSSHERRNGLSEIELRHLWVEMN